MVGDAPIVKSGHVFEINIIDSESCEMILRECGILLVREGCNYISDGIYGELVKKKCCKKAYLRGLFLGVGTINNPEKGYHVEFVFNTEKLASDARKLINSFGLKSKITKRKKHYVVYLKEAEQISDLLSIIGASEQLFKFEDTRIYKEIRNKTNRISNCDHANLDKSVDAAMRQIDAIKLIENGDGLKSLPDKLREVAEIRSSGPRAGLGEIRLPERAAGSSIMPAKVNPIIPEVVNQVCFKVIGNEWPSAPAAFPHTRGCPEKQK